MENLVRVFCIEALPANVADLEPRWPFGARIAWKLRQAWQLLHHRHPKFAIGIAIESVTLVGYVCTLAYNLRSLPARNAAYVRL